MLKRIVSLFVVVLTVLNISAFCAEPNGETANGSARIYGTMNGKQGEPVTLKVLDTNGNVNYIDQQTVDGNGDYEFVFPYTSGRKVYVNCDGECVNQTIKNAASTTIFKTELKAAQNGSYAQIAASIKNIYNVNLEERGIFKLIAGIYNREGVLITANVFDNFTEESKKTEKISLPEGAEYIRCYLWEDLMPVSEFTEKNTGEKVTVDCWGDSLTYGAGVENTAEQSYPSVLQNILGNSYTVNNYGVGGETTETIAGRQGGSPFRLKEDVTVPAEASAVEVKLDNGAPLLQGGRGINPCQIGGITGTLAYDSAAYKYTFTRSEAGDATFVKALSPIMTYAADNSSPDVTVIFAGTNDVLSKKLAYEHQSKKVIDLEKAMIAKLGDNAEYIVLGLTLGKNAEEVEASKTLESIMRQTFGERYVDLRTYLTDPATYEKNNITLNEGDTARMEQGMMPTAILSDNVHFTADGYRLIAGKVYEKMCELGLAVGE